MNNIDASKYIGCLVGGAAGDALGFPVEFMGDLGIVSAFGSKGITEYKLHNGLALFSDDTQMTLFTAVGLLTADAKSGGRYDSELHLNTIAESYIDWLNCQRYSVCDANYHTWLANIKGLYSSRAPGLTCTDAISGFENGVLGSIEKPLNNSKGCGGVMRVAPIGLWGNSRGHSAKDIALLAARASALTHGHELGYIPSAALAHIISTLVSGKGISLYDAVQNAITFTAELFEQTGFSRYFTQLMNKAVELSGSDRSNIYCINSLGQGWVAEEALAIAVYCALRYSDSFEKAIIASVNHSGDSDSTGSITGNILGAYLGIDAIPEKFKADLELYPLITTVARDLAQADIKAVEAFEEKYIAKTYTI